MGIREDRDEFNSTGLRGILGEVMRSKDEAFIKIIEGGWRGQEVAEKPLPGSGPYLHLRRGFPVMEYSNASVTDTDCKEFKVTV